MMRYFGYGGWGGAPWIMGICGVIMAVFFVLLVAFVIRALVWGPRRWGHGAHGMGGHWMNEEDEALAILRRRFAAGEISKEEYEERLKTLKGA